MMTRTKRQKRQQQTESILPDLALVQHLAALGKTGSGKTSTAKLIVEQVVDDGDRVCVLDPVKSDWWGLISSADGKSPGLPFSILGGPHGHVPLHSRAGKAIAELVATGDLPLSILDMAEFEPGGHANFFTDFAETLMKKMRGVLYLVIEEAHLFAPKERSGIGKETMAIHWAKMLATAGRSKGIRMIVATQRTQALHNAVLGSCDTILAHRLISPADQEPVIKWLKANTDKETTQKVSSSLASLKTGEAWICSGEANLVEKRKFPTIRTYDNTKTPTRKDGEHRVHTADVDRDGLRRLIGDAVQEAEANDPTLLRQRIAELTDELANRSGMDESSLHRAVSERTSEALRKARAAFREREEELVWEVDRLKERFNELLDETHEVVTAVDSLKGLTKGLTREEDELRVSTVQSGTDEWLEQHGVDDALNDEAPIARSPLDPSMMQRAHPPTHNNGSAAPIGRGLQKIVDALAWLEASGLAEPRKVVIAAVAGVSPESGGYMQNLSQLRKMGLIEYATRGTASLTAAGRRLAHRTDEPGGVEDLHAMWLSSPALTGGQKKVLQRLIMLYPNPVAKDELARKIDISETSGGYMQNLSRLRKLGLVEYPKRGQVVCTDAIFPQGLK